MSQMSPDLVAGVEVPSSELELNLLVQQVRMFIRDSPELNRLIKGVESSNRQIIWAIADTLDEFNTTPPFTQFGVGNFPSKHLLIRGVVISLLQSVGLLQTRNHLSFSDGGLQVGISDKTPFIQSWIQLFKAEYDQRKERLKVAYNIEQGWSGGVHSEYLFANNFYGWW